MRKDVYHRIQKGKKKGEKEKKNRKKKKMKKGVQHEDFPGGHPS